VCSAVELHSIAAIVRRCTLAKRARGRSEGHGGWSSGCARDEGRGLRPARKCGSLQPAVLQMVDHPIVTTVRATRRKPPGALLSADGEVHASMGQGRIRRLPTIALPASTFVAGRTPRPADGWFDHVDRADWFDFGCDLFDGGFYFEAHELWEQCWRAARDVNNVDDARFLQGLIKLAAAGVKWLAQAPEPMSSHLRGAVKLLSAGPGRRGISERTWRRAVRALEEGQAPTLS
jgi:hypothetical protein